MLQPARRLPSRPHLVAGTVGAVAAAALASSVAGQDRPASLAPAAQAGAATVGATAPVPAVPHGPAVGAIGLLPLPRAGDLVGRIAVLGADCRISTFRLDRAPGAVLRRGGPCVGRLSPGGDAAVGAVGDPNPPVLSGRSLRVAVTGRRERRLGIDGGWATGGEPAVSDAGVVVTCAPGEGPPTSIVWRDGTLRRVAGCWGAFAGDRLLLGLPQGPAAVVDAGGRAVVPRALLARAPLDRVLPAPAGGLVGVLHDAASGSDLDVIATAGGPPRRIATVRAIAGSAVTGARMAPGGHALAVLDGARWRLVAWARPDAPHAIEAIGRSAIVAVAFAPDGRTAAVATGDAVVLVRLPRLTPFARLPGIARDVSWSAGERR